VTVFGGVFGMAWAAPGIARVLVNQAAWHMATTMLTRGGMVGK